MKNKVLQIVVLVLLSTVFILQNLYAQSATDQDKNIFRDFKTEHVLDARVKVGKMIMLGESKHGVRRVIPITGGTFEGPKVKGEVVSGGEDWQLVRPDGDIEFEARYLLKTDDGVLIEVVNKLLMHNPKTDEQTEPYIGSIIDLEAPVDSPYDYLNHAIYIGTFEMSMTPGEDPAVVIGVYKVL